MAYAAGKYSRAMCDRCGFEMAYSDLIEEWTGFKVCSDCFDTKHPQDFPGRHKADAEILRDARPDNDNEPTTILAGQTKMIDGTYINPTIAAGHVGTVTVSTP